MAYLNCPTCHLSISALRARHEHCPRCLRREGQRVSMLASPLPPRLLAAERPAAPGLGEAREQPVEA
jgi:hypothetical protein